MREWLNAQAASGFVELRPSGGVRPAARARARARRRGEPVLDDRHVPGRERRRGGRASALAERFVDGDGVGWHEHHHGLWHGTERAFAAGYRTHLVAEWLPALDGVVEQARGRRARRRRRLRPRRLDDPDGAGLPGLALRRDRLPRRARSRPRASAPPQAGVADRVTFEVAGAADFAGRGLRPRRVLRRVPRPRRPARRGPPRGRARSRPAARCMLVEPFAGDRSRTTSTRSAGSTTGSRRSSARPARCRSPAAPGSAPRPARRALRRGAARGRVRRASAARPRRRSTSCSRPGSA